MARRTVRDDADDETPPWMERGPAPTRRALRAAAREPETTHTFVSWRALIIGAAVAVLAAVGLIIGVRSLIARDPGTVVSSGSAGEVPLIRAPAEPYKMRPTDAGGAQLAGAGDPATSPGGDAIGAIIDTGAAPEAPQRPVASASPTNILPPPGPDVEAGDAQAADPDGNAKPDAPLGALAARATKSPPTSAVAAADTPSPKPKPKRVDPKPKPGPVGTASAGHFTLPKDFGTAARPAPELAAAFGGSLQLGAFSTRERAEGAWARYAAAFPEVAVLHERITPLERGGRTLYRLRASGVGGRGEAICAKLRAAGDACIVSP